MKLIIFFALSLLISSPARCQLFKNGVVNIDEHNSRKKSGEIKNTTSLSVNNPTATKKRQISIAVLNTASAYPFSQFGKLLSGFEHPGIEIGYGFNWKTKSKHDWFQEIKVSYFYHRFVQHGISLYTDIGYRYKFSHSVTAQVAVGAGYMQSIPATAKLKLSDNGEYKNDKGIGRSQAMAVLNLGVGYMIHPASKKSLKIFISYQQFIQTPFVKAYVPILPYNSLLIGCSIPLSSQKK